MIGIYMLIDRSKIVYVGKSINIKKRIKQHKKSDKSFDSYEYIECDEKYLDELEGAMILRHLPKYNVNFISGRYTIMTYGIDCNSDDYMRKYICNKMLEVEELTHLKVKTQAKKRGMTMKDYISFLVNEDKKKIMKGI